MIKFSKRSLILGAGAAFIARPSRALISLRQLPFSPPSGLPGFNPNHLANVAGGVRFSGVAGPGGAMVSLLNGAVPSLGTGQTSGPQASLGQSVYFPNGQYAFNSFPGLNETPIAFTFAAIFTQIQDGTDRCLFATNGQNAPSSSGQNMFVLASGPTPAIKIGATLAEWDQLTPLAVPILLIGSVQSNQLMNFGYVNLQTGQIVCDNTAGGITFTSGASTQSAYSVGGTNSFSAVSASHVAAVMYAANTYLSIAQIRKWLQNPWDFWYPPTISQLMASELRVNSAAGGGSTGYQSLLGVGR